MSEAISHSDGASINHPDKRSLTPEEREKRESYLKDIIGLSPEKLDKLKQDRPSLYSIESMDNKISGLKDRGFSNTHKMIESNPSILNYSFDNIDNKISDLKDRGFSNPHKVIESLPQIFGLGFDNIDNKISELKDRGFTNPNKMIESNPGILGYSIDNIDNKISGLKDRGFTNPNKMIESKLSSLYQLNLNPITTIESNLPILGTKFDKLIVIARILREYQPSSEDIQRKIYVLYTINLESLLISFSQKDKFDNIDYLTRNARNIQKQKLSKDHKRELIKDYFDKNPESYKIYRDYLKGYPEKTQND